MDKMRRFSLLTNPASRTAVILGLVSRICQRIEKRRRLQMLGTGPSMTEERVSHFIGSMSLRGAPALTWLQECAPKAAA
ncbi:MAG: hypothetical protein WA980_02520 [Shinella zoogloeoides]|uniref:hypothetical protein n=1 Tax=Shinella zoogloeoides TaxID=352475 RepID=UPI003C74406A